VGQEGVGTEAGVGLGGVGTEAVAGGGLGGVRHVLALTAE